LKRNTVTNGRFPWLLACIAVCLAATHSAARADEAVVRVAVAANFRTVLETINREFEAGSEIRVVTSSASTGVLANQVAHGAPFDLLLAADRARPEQLHRDRFSELAPPFCYARGSLVLAGSSDGLAALSDPDASLAIANPDVAPYGAAAMAVLARPEFAAGASRKLVRGASVLQAYQFWASGNVELALLPRALVPDATAPIPQDWHAPIDQYALALNEGPALARYLQWLKSDRVQGLITDAGYEPCH
jgi:molybdate transport system substrate-binding protein